MVPSRGVPDAPSPLNPTDRLTPVSAGRAVDSDDSAHRSVGAQAQLLADVAGALHANLARGFLEGEERIRQIAEALNDVVLLSDAASGQVFFVNAAYERMWGRPRADLYANPLALLEGVHPEDRDRVRDALIGQRREDFDIEFRVVRSAGDERWMWTRGFLVRGVDGETTRIASITADVTEHKQIAASHEQLIRGFTHDMKNPLGAADGYLSLLEAGVFGRMSEAQAQSIANARRAIDTALHLVSGLLEVERAEARQLSIERAEVDLGAVVFEIAAEFRAAAAAKSLDFAVSDPQDEESHVSLVIESDAARVPQILANLASNAVKYTQPGGRILVAARVALAGETPWHGRGVAVTVTDNGSGIPFEKQAMVFREFARFDPGAAAGSGIGLAISRRLARALGGDITFTSTPGVGSAFTLWLPLDQPREPGDSTPAARGEERA
ncbi:MAG: ATP-binding region ATPase domain protein [Geminicoccaceae bacterium]|nr:ATP-binding region ATPase domain protein [Geminicoccaceae bacterium]